MQFKHKRFKAKKTTFLYDVIKSWAEIKKTNDETKPISTEIIWNNSHIKIVFSVLILTVYITSYLEILVR